MVSFCNLIGSSKSEEVIVDRKCTEALPGPFSDFSDGAWERGYYRYTYSRHYFQTELRTLFNIHTITAYFTYDCDNCRLTMYIYNNSNAGLIAALIFVRSRLSSESSRQRGLGHLKGNLRMRHIVNTNW